MPSPMASLMSLKQSLPKSAEGGAQPVEIDATASRFWCAVAPLPFRSHPDQSGIIGAPVDQGKRLGEIVVVAHGEGALVAEAEQSQPASTDNSSRIGIVIAMAIRNIQRRPLRSSFAGAESRHGQWATLASTKSGICLMRLQQRLSRVSDQQNRVPRFVISPAIAMRDGERRPLAPNDKRLKPTRVNDIRGRLQPLRHAKLGTRRRSLRLNLPDMFFCPTRSGF